MKRIAAVASLALLAACANQGGPSDQYLGQANLKQLMDGRNAGLFTVSRASCTWQTIHDGNLVIKHVNAPDESYPLYSRVCVSDLVKYEETPRKGKA